MAASASSFLLLVSSGAHHECSSCRVMMVCLPVATINGTQHSGCRRRCVHVTLATTSIRRVTGIHLPVVRLWPHAWTSTINQHLLQSPAQTKHPRYSTPTRPCVFFGLRIYHHVLFFPLCLFVSCHVLRPCPTPSSYLTRLPECTGTEGREFYRGVKFYFRPL